MSVYFAGFVPCDQGYAVFFPDLPGCNSQGETLPEAFSMAMEALAGHLEAMADDGEIIPAPSGEAEALRKFKEQFAGLDMGPMPDGSVLHPVPAPELDTATAKVNVSFARYKLDMIDRKAKAAGMTRSGFLAAAAGAYAVE
ncbi:MAG: type II toxin-antitoxin system HicB family antitoxin [Desulfovibrio sp.]|nr:type II toxin-antitoxin system HicB family antitoxin [Desulfovibrio sp.]